MFQTWSEVTVGGRRGGAGGRHGAQHKFMPSTTTVSPGRGVGKRGVNCFLVSEIFFYVISSFIILFYCINIEKMTRFQSRLHNSTLVHTNIYSECLSRPVVLGVFCCSMCLFLYRPFCHGGR